MSNIDLNLDTICNLRKRQQLFAMPSFRATPISPYPTYTQRQLDMRRKFEILQYPNNRLNTRTNNLTKKSLFAQAITGKYQKQSYAPIHTDTVRYTYDPLFKLDSVNIDRTTEFPVPECPTDDLIQTPTSSSDVPGPIIKLYKDPTVPLYNYANSSVENYAITDVDNQVLWKTNTIGENTTSLSTITVINSDLVLEPANDTTMASIMITDKINVDRYTYSLQIPIGVYFKGTYKGTTPKEFAELKLSFSNVNFNPQVVFANNPIETNRIIEYSIDNGNISEITFDVPANGENFSGSLYTGMLTISNMELYTEPGYIYDFNILADVKFTQDNINDFSNNYDFSYGVKFNMTEASKKSEIGCTITTDPSENERLPLRVTGQLA